MRLCRCWGFGIVVLGLMVAGCGGDTAATSSSSAVAQPTTTVASTSTSTVAETTSTAPVTTIQEEPTASLLPGMAVEEIAGDIGSGPHSVLATSDAYWVIDYGSGTVHRFDGTTGQMRSVDFPRGDGSRTSMAIGFGGIWVVDSEAEQLLRVDTTTGQLESVDLGVTPEFVEIGLDRIWVGYRHDGFVGVVNPATRFLTGIVDTPLLGAPRVIEITLDSIWVLGEVERGHEDLPQALVRIDRATLAIETTLFEPEDNHFYDLAVMNGYLWIPNIAGDELIRITPETGEQVRFPVGDQPHRLVRGGGSLWVSTGWAYGIEEFSLQRFDPATETLEATVDLGPGLAPSIVFALSDEVVFVSSIGSDGVLAVDLRTGEATETGLGGPDGIPVSGMEVVGGSLWLLDGDAGSVLRFTPTDN